MRPVEAKQPRQHRVDRRRLGAGALSLTIGNDTRPQEVFVFLCFLPASATTRLASRPSHRRPHSQTLRQKMQMVSTLLA